MEKLSRLINSILWDTDLATMLSWRARLIVILRIGHNVIGDLADGQLTLRAMSLVYTTLLSIVPLLAVSFSVLKGFGVHNQLEPMLLNMVAPLGEKGIEIAQHIIHFVDNTKAGVLGTVGLAFLLYTAVSLVQKIEQAFNHIWRIRRHRRFSERFSDYLSVIMVGPVLVVTAVGLTASVTSNTVVQALSEVEPLGSLFEIVGRILPYILLTVAFTFLYIFLPNTRVRFRSALIGGVVTALLWNTVGWAFASFVVTSAKYTAIYSTFATLVLFMFWLYIAWLILMVGSSIAFYHQHPECLSRDNTPIVLSGRDKEQIGLAVMQLVVSNFYRNKPALNDNTLVEALAIPMNNLQQVTDALVKAGLLSLSEEQHYLPGKAPETTPLIEVIHAVRNDTGYHPLPSNSRGKLATSEKVCLEIEAYLAESLHGKTIKSLLD